MRPLLRLLHPLHPSKLASPFQFHRRFCTQSPLLSRLPAAPLSTLLSTLSPLLPTVCPPTSPASLHTLTTLHSRLSSLTSQISDTETLLLDPDPDLAHLASDELITLSRTHAQLAGEVIDLLIEHHYPPTPPSNALLEFRAGTGGDEAALFVADLVSMYTSFFAHKSWTYAVLSQSTTSLGGVRELIIRVRGHDAYNVLALEAGVHRVQRVPETDSQGRLHTSTASLAVLRDVKPTEVRALDMAEVRIDVYRASGAGGQHVNTTESAVRATHVPTGIVAMSQDERSQHRNRAAALQALATRVAARVEEQQRRKRVEERRRQLGSSVGERSDRIRTYNYPQRRVTDHRIVPQQALVQVVPEIADVMPGKSANLQAVMGGADAFEKLMMHVRQAYQMQCLTELLQHAQQLAVREKKNEQQQQQRRKASSST